MGIEVEYQFRPIDEWPGELTRNHQRSRFEATYTASLNLLTREVAHIIERRYGTAGQPTGPVILGLALDDGQIVQDRSRPYANASPRHPGVLVAFKSKHGPLRYATDTFRHWHDNLRAIALGLEALRKVDRYGITKRGEQYRGFAALTSGTTGLTSAEEAFAVVRRSAVKVRTTVTDLHQYRLLTASGRETFHRAAQRGAHPDAGGSDEEFVRVMDAIDFLRRNVR